ncbi:MAG: hypothetical protein QXD82_00895 [Nitrososphaerales archaeon]
MEDNRDLKERVTNMCKEEKMRCIFRANISKFKKSEALKGDHLIYTARNVDEARSCNVPFYLLEAGKDMNETLKVIEFCARQSNINLAIEFDFAPLRLHNEFSFASYMKYLKKLVNICKRRQIVTIFSSGAKNSNELVSPRVLYSFYTILGGNLTRRKILHEIPNREVIEKIDLGPEIIGRLG